MKHIFILFFCLAILCGTSCQEKKCELSLSSQYNGWIYLVQSNEAVRGNIFLPDSNGVVYVPKELIKSDSYLHFTIDGKPESSSKWKIYDVSYYPEGSKKKVVYKKFYLPLSQRDVDEKTISYYDRELPFFDYLIVTNRIDTTKVLN